MYQVVFTGKLVYGFNAQTVIRNLETVFALNFDTATKLISSPGAVVKRNIDVERAERLRATMERCGAMCEVRPMADTSAESSREPELGASAAVGPDQTGRRNDEERDPASPIDSNTAPKGSSNADRALIVWAVLGVILFGSAGAYAVIKRDELARYWDRQERWQAADTSLARQIKRLQSGDQYAYLCNEKYENAKNAYLDGKKEKAREHLKEGRRSCDIGEEDSQGFAANETDDDSSGEVGSSQGEQSSGSVQERVEPDRATCFKLRKVAERYYAAAMQIEQKVGPTQSSRRMEAQGDRLIQRARRMGCWQ